MNPAPANSAPVPETTPAYEAELQSETPLEAIASIAFVLAIGLWVMGFVFQNFVIPSGSMESTLLIGDHVVVDRETLAPPTHWAPFVHYRPVQRGDIIVFFKPNPEQPDLILVKRAMAIAGDHIHLEHGHVFINGKPVQEGFARMPDDAQPLPQDHYIPYRDDFPAITPDYSEQLTEVWRQDLPTHIVNGELVVPPGKVFAMGDNRTESLDSRYWGFVPVENIMGRPLFVYWSFDTPADQENKTDMADRLSFMAHVVIHIFDQTRWKRTLHVVR
jgi:signal peptidase I